MTLSREIKKVLNKNGVKNSVSTYTSTITVTVKSEISEEVYNEVKAMQTLEGTGSIIDDTRSYTGLSVQFNFQYEPTEEQVKKAADLYNSWVDSSKEDFNTFSYHFKKQLREQIGPTGIVIANKIYKMY